ncbi:MAG: hypothetical protein ACLFPD_03820 [Desulfosudaceae bacterium]
MDPMDKARRQTLALLQSIQSAGDWRDNEDELLDSFEELFKTAVISVKEFSDRRDALAPAEMMAGLERFQDEHFLFDPAFEKETTRIDNLPDTAAAIASFQQKLDARTNHLLAEYMALLNRIVNERL